VTYPSCDATRTPHGFHGGRWDRCTTTVRPAKRNDDSARRLDRILGGGATTKPTHRPDIPNCWLIARAPDATPIGHRHRHRPLSTAIPVGRSPCPTVPRPSRDPARTRSPLRLGGVRAAARERRWRVDEVFSKRSPATTSSRPEVSKPGSVRPHRPSRMSNWTVSTGSVRLDLRTPYSTVFRTRSSVSRLERCRSSNSSNGIVSPSR